MKSEDELRALCAHFLAGQGEQADEEALVADPELAAEIEHRLAAVGVRLVRGHGQAPLAVVEGTGEDLGELSLACLALVSLSVHPRVAPASVNGKRPRITVNDIWERVGKPRGYSEAYLRRTGLGPLEQRGLIKVVKPEQRASEAYVVAGPALGAIDAESLKTRIETLRKAS